MSDPFLVGLVAGGVVGAAGVAAVLLRVAAIAVIAGGTWLVASHGVDGVETALAEALLHVGSGHGRFALGAFVGALLGSSLLRGLGRRGS